MENLQYCLQLEPITEDKICDLFDKQIVLTNINTWDPGKLWSSSKVRTANTSVIHLTKKIPTKSLIVCSLIDKNS